MLARNEGYTYSRRRATGPSSSLSRGTHQATAQGSRVTTIGIGRAHTSENREPSDNNGALNTNRS